jgi:uncharacterized repeat protein (TIGR03803 family)
VPFFVRKKLAPEQDQTVETPKGFPMRSKKLSIGLTAVLAISAVTLLVTGTRAVAQQEKALYSFNRSNGAEDGFTPFAGLIFDASGNLYGMTSSGGAFGGGAVFKLTPQAGGGWTETILHSFVEGTDGAFPLGSLTLDAAGNLYGMTSAGGGGNGFGAVFELTPSAGGVWSETVLHRFGNSNDGAYPYGSLILDTAGNLYGTTGWGGSGACVDKFNAVGCGIVFELSPQAGGVWAEKILHNFNGTDGFFPQGSLIFDAAGNLYGTTATGGAAGFGTVFELSPTASGLWTGKLLHTFHGNENDGATPQGGVIFDSAGNLYGVTFGGGAHNWGTAYELVPRAGGGWGEKILHNFNQSGSAGAFPRGGLIFDAAGNLYGTTSTYGAEGYGNVFELTPTATGPWTEKVLHSFRSLHSNHDGIEPEANLVFDAAGNLYSTASGGGVYGGGTVFEITP